MKMTFALAGVVVMVLVTFMTPAVPAQVSGVGTGTASVDAASVDASDTDVQSPARERAVLRLVTTDTAGERVAAIRYVTHAFQAVEGGWPVEVTAVPEDRLIAFVEAERAAGRRIDVINTGVTWLGSDSILPHLDRSLHREVVTAVGTRRFASALLDDVALDETGAWAVPFHGWVQALWFRTAHLQSVQPPDTVERLIPFLSELSKKPETEHPLIMGTAGGAYGRQFLLHLIHAGGGRIVATSGEPTLQATAVVEAAEAFRELARFTPPGDTTTDDRDRFLDGRSPVMVYSTFIMDDIVEASGSSRGDVAIVPVLRSERAASGFYSLNVLAALQTEERRRAAVRDLLVYLFRPDVYLVWLHSAPGGMLPVLTDIPADGRFLQDPQGVFVRYDAALLRTLLDGFTRPATGSRSPIAERHERLIVGNGVIDELARDLSSTDVPVEELLRAAQRRARAILAAAP